MTSHETIENIKSKIDIVDLISLDCELSGSGDEYRGAHENRHQSESGNCLVVNRSEGMWYCHSQHCKCGGDCFDWIADREGLDIKNDFHEILQIAADYAGVEIPGELQNHERRRVFECMTAAAEHFHSNLTNEMYDDIEARWGITRATCDKMRIGISKTDHSLEEYLLKQGFTFDEMHQTGLFTGDVSLFPYFKGRYVFPYWVQGQVRYMIARATKWTPDTKYEKTKNGNIIKFKKLRTRSKKAKYISEYVRNDVIFGVDSMKSGEGDYCIITEGIADAIMAIQAGFACVSPVTTLFREKDHAPILRLVKKFKKVYICMDNEKNEAGLAGAYSIAKHLIKNGVDASIVELPRSSGVDKIDLAEYLRDHSVESFKNLFISAYKPPEFFLPPAEMFLNEKGVFAPNLFADWIFNESGLYFLTFIDSEETIYYDGGLYKPHGEKYIGKIIEEVMAGHKVSKRDVGEVVGHINRRTYIEREMIDNDINLINIENGLLNIKTREFKPHTPEYYSMAQVGIRYDPEAECPAFDQFLLDILPETVDRMRIEDLFGYCLIRDYRIQKWFMFHGQGANGKGTLLEVLKKFLGSHNVSGVELQRLDDPFLPAELYGKLANIVGDLSSKELYQTGRLKSLSSGTDVIQAQKKYGQPFTFINHAKLIYAANELPKTKDQTLAFWRRVCLLEFRQTFVGKKDDRHMVEKLTTEEELSGILNHALAGVERIINDDSILTIDDYERVEKLYIRGADSIESFYTDMITITTDENDQIGGNEIYKHYLKYCEDGNTTAKTQTRRTFTSQLMTKPGLDYTENLYDENGKKMRGWRFIKVKDYSNPADEKTCNSHAQHAIPLFVSRTKRSPENLKKSENQQESDKRVKRVMRVEDLSDESKQKILDAVKSRIWRLGYSKGFTEFTSMHVLMEMKGYNFPEKLTVELIEQMIDDNIEMFQFLNKPIIKSGDKYVPKEE
ncbi:MAG: toprim domain-containing protein [candidate division Zixibacteria bacterium]|nr:toprim domain-containing protein [candidate division Zixibacteria bacterium]